MRMDVNEWTRASRHAWSSV